MPTLYEILAAQIEDVSIEDLADDIGETISDCGRQAEDMEAEENAQSLLKLLTKRQRDVATLLAQGYDRQEIADNRGVCIQSVHQIVIRIKHRLANRAGVSMKGWRRQKISHED